MSDSLHHTHLMASDIEATIAFWQDGFGGEVVHDAVFAGARNVFMQVGEGRIHFYEQPPKVVGQGTVHHLGIRTDNVKKLAARLSALGYSVTPVRHEPTAAYAMVKGPDAVLVELFEPVLDGMPERLRAFFGPSRFPA
jgi:catechol 2,3-dioxygenase-like lactoylglutathione lyase family enzyme